jgi:hypothetical protein
VCFRAPGNDADRDAVDALFVTYQNNGHHLKQVFAEAAASPVCRGQ